MNKKGQIQQVFIYILTIVVVGLILVIGYKAIGGVLKQGCDVEMINFKNTIDSEISKHTSYGSFYRKEIKAPCEYMQVCFISPTSIDDDSFTETETAGQAGIIENSVRDGIKENIFLVKNDMTDPISYKDELTIEGSMLCINRTNNEFYVAFEGLGRATRIMPGAAE